MLSNLQPILADTDIPAKAIGFIIVVTIYGIGALASWLSKQKKQHDEEIQRREQIRRAVQMQQASAMAAARHQQHHQQQAYRPPPPPPRTPTTTHAPAVPPPPMTRRPPRAPARRAVPVPPIRPSTLPPLPVEEIIEGPSGSSVLATTEIGSRPAARLSAAAPAIARRLTPSTLRQQFIVTEILQPPLAVRDRDG